MQSSVSFGLWPFGWTSSHFVSFAPHTHYEESAGLIVVEPEQKTMELQSPKQNLDATSKPFI